MKNKYVLYIDQVSYGPFEAVVRGWFRTPIKRKSDYQTYDFLSQRLMSDVALVDQTTGAVIVAGAKLLTVRRNTEEVEVRLDL